MSTLYFTGIVAKQYNLRNVNLIISAIAVLLSNIMVIFINFLKQVLLLCYLSFASREFNAMKALLIYCRDHMIKVFEK
jgi:hypothetical protein